MPHGLAEPNYSVTCQHGRMSDQLTVLFFIVSSDITTGMEQASHPVSAVLGSLTHSAKEQREGLTLKEATSPWAISPYYLRPHTQTSNLCFLK